jgi:hypothetical protein
MSLCLSPNEKSIWDKNWELIAYFMPFEHGQCLCWVVSTFYLFGGQAEKLLMWLVIIWNFLIYRGLDFKRYAKLINYPSVLAKNEVCNLFGPGLIRIVNGRWYLWNYDQLNNYKINIFQLGMASYLSNHFLIGSVSCSCRWFQFSMMFVIETWK